MSVLPRGGQGQGAALPGSSLQQKAELISPPQVFGWCSWHGGDIRRNWPRGRNGRGGKEKPSCSRGTELGVVKVDLHEIERLNWCHFRRLFSGKKEPVSRPHEPQFHPAGLIPVSPGWPEEHFQPPRLPCGEGQKILPVMQSYRLVAANATGLGMRNAHSFPVSLPLLKAVWC